MAKTESSLKNMVVVLVAIAIIAGLSLGAIFLITKDPIAQSSMQKKQEAIKLVVPPFNNSPIDESYVVTLENGLELTVFPAKMENEIVGLAVESFSNKGFSGEIRVMVGLKPTGEIINYTVLRHLETPGLGSKMEEWFRPSVATNNDKTDNETSIFQWLFGIKASNSEGRNIIGKNPKSNNLTVKQDKGEVDGITAATISSRAFLEAVQIAFETSQKGLIKNLPVDSINTSTIENKKAEIK